MMKRNLMDNLISEAQGKLNNGASLEALQNDLKNNLKTLTPILKLSDKEIERYNNVISGLGVKPKARITSINRTRLAAIAIASVIGGGSLYGGYSLAKSIPVAKAEQGTEALNDDTEYSKETVGTTAPTTTTETTQADVEYVLPDYLAFDVNDTDLAIQNVSEFLNDGLSKGLTTVKDEKTGKLVSSLTEDNKSKKVEAYLSMYIMANINNVDYKMLASLNQEGNLIADNIFEKAINAMGETYYDSLTETKGNVLKNELIFADKNDVNYINQFDELIVKFNEASDSERKEIIKEAKKLKEDLLVYIAGKKTEINPFAIDYAFTKIEVLDTLANGKIITDSEEDINLYNAVIADCITPEQKEKYGIKDALTKFNDAKSLTSLKSIVRNMAYSVIEEKMEAAITYATQVEPNSKTSFNYIVSEIANKIDLNNFKANPYDFSDWVLKVTNQDVDDINNAIKNNKPTVKTVTRTNVDPKDVPDDQKVKPTTESKVKEDGKEKESNKTYIKAKAKAIEDASKDVANLYQKLGSSLKISTKSVPSKPSTTCEDYNKVYNYWYAVTWNSSLKEFQNAERKAKEENKNTDSEYKDTKDKVVDKSDNYDDPKPADEYYYVPEDNVVVVDDGIIEEEVEINSKEYDTEPAPSKQDTQSSSEDEVIYEEPTTQVDEGLLMSSYPQTNSYASQIQELEALKSQLLETTNSLDEYISSSRSL